MKQIVIIFALFVVITACDKSEYDLEKSIYVPDDEYNALPAYTEWGYNTFGAFYERKLFIFNDAEIPAKVIHTDNLAKFILTGSLLEPSPYVVYNGFSYYGPTMSLSFDLPDFHPETYEDLIDLNNKTFDLTDPNLNVTAVVGPDTLDMGIFNGQLQFRKAQHLLVDKQPINVILSGYFGFQALVNGKPISMAHGRFDVGIDEYDFARY
ncbi:MAG TPA: hypothetical protein VHI78_13605 [Bacteroidales bacterium]|jgi:hypothetical protein|nr:hypothetical protein [Bacteroidales bacterium]